MAKEKPKKTQPRQQTLTTTDLARVIDVTPAYIRKLTADGIIQRARDVDGSELVGRYTLTAVRDYCRWVRAHKEGDDGESRWRQLRNQRAEYEAERARLQVNEMKGKLHRAEDIDFVLTQLFTSIRQKLLALPSRVARRIEGKKFREILTIITTEIHTVLRELTKFDEAMVARKAEQYLKAQRAEGENGTTEPTESD
jgi:phage terminase Nu1 subunit (DNA packaging protein)